MYLPSELYRRLDEVAKAADREAVQQAIHFIRQGLAREQPSDARQTEPVG
jgi:predicted transcriptional regulator